jgi:hypothetical protein
MPLLMNAHTRIALPQEGRQALERQVSGDQDPLRPRLMRQQRRPA